MTISSTTSRNDYVGNGSTSVYSYTFKIFLDADLLVTKKNLSNVESTLVLNTDYTVSGATNSGGGSITLLGGNLTSGYTLTIRRVRPLTQLTDIRNQGSFFPEAHEDEFDMLTMVDQQQQDEIARSVTLPESVLPSAFDPTLPTGLANNPGSAVIVNDAGTGFALGINTGGTDASRVAKAGDTMTGNLIFASQKGVKLSDSDSSNSITMKAPSVVPADYSVVFPAAVPTARKVLKYDGTNYVWEYCDGIVSAKSADYTVTDTDTIGTIFVTTGAPTPTITLPAAANNVNRIITIKKIDSGVGMAIVSGSGPDFVSGTIQLYDQNESIQLQSDGTNWLVIASAGCEGKYLETLVTSPTNVTANGNYMDCASLLVPVGDWSLTALLNFTNNGATISQNPVIGISTTSGNSSTGLIVGVNTGKLLATADTPSSGNVPNYRQKLSAPTTYYLKLTTTSSVATPTYTCRLSAVRIRR